MNRELAKLILAQISQHSAMAGVRLIVPLLALRQGQEAMAVGILLSLFSVSQIFLALPAGRYADRYGMYRPVVFSVIASMGGTALALIWQNFETLCIAAFCTGGATGTIVIALQRHAGRLSDDPKELKQIFSWIALGPAIANFIGPFFTGLCIDYLGFSAAFGLTLVVPLLSWLLVRGTKQYVCGIESRATENLPSFWTLLYEQRFRRLMVVNWLLASCWDIHTFIVPILGHERDFTATAIGSILGAFAVAAFLIRIVLPLLAARLSEHSIIAGAMLITAVIFAFYPLMPNALSMGFCSTLLGFTLGVVQPMAMSLLHQITPHERHAQAIGLRLIVVNTSSVSMPLLFGSLGAAIGVSAVFWIAGVGVGIGSRLAYSMRRQARESDAQRERKKSEG